MAVRYRNEYIKEWTEVAAANRFRLDREERAAYDAVATDRSPTPLDWGDLVEVKATQPWIQNGDEYGTSGRFHITVSTHHKLADKFGYYCFVVYSLVDNNGQRVVVERMKLVEADEITQYISQSDNVKKLSHLTIFDEL